VDRSTQPEFGYCQKPKLRRDNVADDEDTCVRAVPDRESRETGTLSTARDGTTKEELVDFRRFVTSFRRERERLGLGLADVAG
jgi:hypothetical protein